VLGACLVSQPVGRRGEQRRMWSAEGWLIRPSGSCASSRAYSGWRGESVTRGDRRRRELEVRKFVSAARPPARIDGAMDSLGSLSRERALCIDAHRGIFLVC
jgi:hypothetical protein